MGNHVSEERVTGNVERNAETLEREIISDDHLSG